ncbi:MAG: Flp pilus assembly protein CpaB [Bdellovibrionaceae bacterium]|nr:Flp pilus assembly protein CpaB [Pseudobdellovibrionaceae bacterium]
MSSETRNLWISIGAGLFAAFLLYSYSQEKKAELEKRFGETVRVVVAKEDISEMQTIYDTMLTTEERPKDYVLPDAIKLPEEVVGNVAGIPIKKGQIIVKNMLLSPGPDTGIALQIAPTKRAVTIPVDDVRSVAKLIRPGDRVDIFAALDVGKGANVRREVALLMQDVVVLATGVSVVNNIPRVFEMDDAGSMLTQYSLTGDTKYSTVTVEASPKEAQDLYYLLSTAPGNIFFSLRNPNDRQPIGPMSSSTVDSIIAKATGSPEPSRTPTGNTPPVQIPNQFRPPGGYPGN